MIVCSCNVLTDHQLRSVLDTELARVPRTAGQLYKCMGCQPQCGRCLPTIQRLIVDHGEARACAAGCAACPIQHHPAADNDLDILAVAAE